MSKIMRGPIDRLERVHFRDLESISDSSEQPFEVVDYCAGAEIYKPTGSQVQEEPQPEQEERPKKKNNSRTKKNKDNSKAEEQKTQQLEMDIESIRNEAYAQGEISGRKKVQAELDSALKAFSKAAQELDGLRFDMVKRQSDDLVRLAMVVAEQVIHIEVSLHEEIIVPIVRKAMQSAFDSDEYQVRVNPADVHIIQENRPLLLAAVNGLRQIHVQGDESIQRGGCVVESNKGHVDARLESTLQAIQDQLKQAVESK